MPHLEVRLECTPHTTHGVQHTERAFAALPTCTSRTPLIDINEASAGQFQVCSYMYLLVACMARVPDCPALCSSSIFSPSGRTENCLLCVHSAAGSELTSPTTTQTTSLKRWMDCAPQWTAEPQTRSVYIAERYLALTIERPSSSEHT